MKLKEVEIKRLSDYILERLEKKKMITIKTDPDDVRDRIVRVIEEDIASMVGVGLNITFYIQFVARTRRANADVAVILCI